MRLVDASLQPSTLDDSSRRAAIIVSRKSELITLALSPARMIISAVPLKQCPEDISCDLGGR
jgi:hypothetical protein